MICLNLKIPEKIIIIIFIIIIIIIIRVFDTSDIADGLSPEFEWHQVSNSLVNILVDLKSVVVWIVSILPLISISLNLFSRL